MLVIQYCYVLLSQYVIDMLRYIIRSKTVTNLFELICVTA